MEVGGGMRIFNWDEPGENERYQTCRCLFLFFDGMEDEDLTNYQAFYPNVQMFVRSVPFLDVSGFRFRAAVERG